MNEALVHFTGSFSDATLKVLNNWYTSNNSEVSLENDASIIHTYKGIAILHESQINTDPTRLFIFVWMFNCRIITIVASSYTKAEELLRIHAEKCVLYKVDDLLVDEIEYAETDGVFPEVYEFQEDNVFDNRYFMDL
jgi:hypothetical protein